MDNTNESVAPKRRPEVLFVEGALMVDGVRVPLPARPKNESVGVMYDVLSLLGVAASVAVVIAQLIAACNGVSLQA